MGLFTPEQHEHYHLSKDAAKEQRLAAEAEASARRYEADCEEETAKRKMDHEAKMKLLEKDPEAYMRLLAIERKQKIRNVLYIVGGVILFLIVVGLSMSANQW